jgi:hypothetical protein
MDQAALSVRARVAAVSRRRFALDCAGHAIWGDAGDGRAGGNDVVMPTISRFLGIVIAMFYDDHGPAHFHARTAEGSAKVRIDTLEVIDSTLTRRHLRFVLAWAELHQEELLENWRLARAGETLQQIEPLR